MSTLAQSNSTTSSTGLFRLTAKTETTLALLRQLEKRGQKNLEIVFVQAYRASDRETARFAIVDLIAGLESLTEDHVPKIPIYNHEELTIPLSKMNGKSFRFKGAWKEFSATSISADMPLKDATSGSSHRPTTPRRYRTRVIGDVGSTDEMHFKTRDD